MILTITEANHWEHERWHYILDAEKQRAAALNDLISFIRLNNIETERIKKEVDANQDHSAVTDMFGRPMYKLFAASSYWFRFYDSMEIDEKYGYPVVINGRSRLAMNGGAQNYKSGIVDLTLRISQARMYSALKLMQDKKENKLYKNFESLFLKQLIKEAA